MKLINGLRKTFIATMMIATVAVNANASTTVGKPTLTLEQAVSRAITSCDKKTVYGSYLSAYEEITKYNQDYFSANFRNSKLQEKKNKFSMEHINEKIAYDTTDTYLSVVLLNEQIDMAKNNISVIEKQLRQLEIMKEKGVASQQDYKTCEDNLIAAKANLVALEKSLENEALDFKNLTRMDINSYELETTFEIEPVAIEGAVSSYFERNLQDYFSLQEEAIKIKELNKADMFGVTLGEYNLQEADITSSEYSLKNQKETMLTTLMNSYNSLDGLKAQVATYETKINSDKENLKAQEIKYNNGYISQLEYEKALLQGQSLECDKFSAVKTYITTKMMVENPNILAMQYLG